MTAVMVPVEKDIFSVTKTPYSCVKLNEFYV